MATTRNGQTPPREPARKLRFDDLRLSSGGDNLKSGRPDQFAMTGTGQGHSGRRFVVVAGFVVLLTWGALYLAFQGWKAKYRQRADYGSARVVSVIDRLDEIVPAGVDPAAWRDAVEKTRAMLTTVVGSNLLDIDKMDELRAELNQSVDRALAHPEAGRDELALIWNEMADRAEFLFQDSRSPTHDRHVRPRLLPPRPEKAKAKPAVADH
jgi:hypothetical protein